MPPRPPKSKRRPPPSPPADVSERRARKLATRIRIAATGVDKNGQVGIVSSVDAALTEAQAIADPRARLRHLLDVADSVRPHLHPETVRHVLPEHYSTWRD